MRILVDGYNIVRPEGTGVATYGRSFIGACHLLGHDVSVLFGAERSSSSLSRSGDPTLLQGDAPLLPGQRKLQRIVGGVRSFGGFDSNRVEQLDQPPRSSSFIPGGTRVHNAYGLYAYAIGGHRKLGSFTSVRVPGIDVAHWTYPLPIRAAGAINIYTMHDLVPLLHPELTLDSVARYRRLCLAVAANADLILTVSQQSQMEIVTALGVDPSKVVNTYQPHVIDAATRKAAVGQSAVVTERFDLKRGKYFLYFGAIEPKKNIARLLEAYFLSGTATPLILVGGGGWLVERELAPWRVRQSSPEGRQVRQIGFQDRNTLLALVAGARAVFFPSLSEGFGLPALEAMALGTPVMASRAGGLNEVVGEAALTVDPFDTAEMARCITLIDANETLRASLASQGQEQAGKFTMAAYLDRLAPVLASLGERRGGLT